MTDFNSGCVGKIGYETWDKASAKATKHSHGKPYRCRHCRKWHVGGTEEQMKPKRREVVRLWSCEVA